LHENFVLSDNLKLLWLHHRYCHRIESYYKMWLSMLDV